MSRAPFSLPSGISRTVVQNWVMTFCVAIFSLMAVMAPGARDRRTDSKQIVARGWHPWYEVKADPENADNLIVCGSAWDAQRNALQGFVYVSKDGGKIWAKALADQSSSWVSEQSCAFGPEHKAFFISEASKTIDEEGRHHQGTTRIFTSNDAGQHWKESAQTAWADWSTSAVRVSSGELFTFFNDASSRNPESRLGNTVGLLIFRQATNHIFGPFVSPLMNLWNYQGVYPSDALGLKDGTMAVLYLGYRDTASGKQADLGLETVSSMWPPAPVATLITTSNLEQEGNCLGLGNYAMAYDAERGQLFVVYRKANEKSCSLVLSMSSDEGRSWGKSVPILVPNGEKLDALRPSIAIGPDGELRVLWNDSQDWFFVRVNRSGSASEPSLLHTTNRLKRVIRDSLWTVFRRANNQLSGEKNDADSVGLNVRTLPGRIWRASELATTGKGIQAVFLGVDAEDEKLYSLMLPDLPAKNTFLKVPESALSEVDVTRQAVLLYGRGQIFDNATGNLSVEVRLGNRGDTPIRTPVRLEVVGVSSEAGKVTILNSDNGEKGKGAIWYLSGIVVGDQILPASTTYNTATLLFHIDLARPGPMITSSLLSLDARVIGGSKADAQTPPSEGK
jgi:hypothetical protein